MFVFASFNLFCLVYDYLSFLIFIYIFNKNIAFVQTIYSRRLLCIIIIIRFCFVRKVQHSYKVHNKIKI